MKLLLLILVSAFTLVGCGDLFGTKAKEKEIDTDRFRANCELDINRFSLILHEPIANDIRCLRANLHLFIEVVENDRPGYMSRSAFEAYLRNYRDDISDDVINALKAIYDINYLLTGDDREYISKASVDKITNFAIIFNTEAVRYFAKNFQNERPATYPQHEYARVEVREAANRIRSALDDVHNENGSDIRAINIIDLLTSFTTAETRPHIEKVKEVLFVKKILLGGKKDVLTHKELENLVNNSTFADLTVLALDGVRHKYIDMNQRSLLNFINNNLKSLHEIIYSYGNRTNETFFTIDEAMDVVKLFVPKDTLDITKYKKLIVEAKKVFMGGSETTVTGGDFRKFMDHVSKVLNTGESFHEMYMTFFVPLESKLGPLIINYEQNRDIFIGREAEFKRFIRTVKDYRFMKGEFESPFYTRGWWRNADAIFEIYLFEYIIEQLFAYKEPSGESWGIPGSASGNFSHHVDQPKFEKLVLKFEKELVNMDLILPGRAVSTSDTISLLATLFQYQSSQVTEAVPVMDVNEATEFALTLVSGISMAKELMVDFREQCTGDDIDQFDRISPTCFKKHYFKNFCEAYRRNFPLLFQDIGYRESCDDIEMTEYNDKFLDSSIKAARTCNYYNDAAGKPTTEEIYYSEGDIMTIIVAMMHIETTMLRWDTIIQPGEKEPNNKWDADEADRAYSVYSTALDGFLVDKPGIIKKLKKQIYWYLLKYEEIPQEGSFGGIVKFVKFLVSFKHRTGATRKTMAAVLKTIGEENAKLRATNGEKPWDCNLLRDPDNIPRDYTSRTGTGTQP